jgi:hypothetical protein
MPYKKHAVAIRAVADETGTRKEWVEQVCRDAPPPTYSSGPIGGICILWRGDRYFTKY